MRTQKSLRNKTTVINISLFFFNIQPFHEVFLHISLNSRLICDSWTERSTTSQSFQWNVKDFLNHLSTFLSLQGHQKSSKKTSAGDGKGSLTRIFKMVIYIYFTTLCQISGHLLVLFSYCLSSLYINTNRKWLCCPIPFLPLFFCILLCLSDDLSSSRVSKCDERYQLYLAVHLFQHWYTRERLYNITTAE